MTRETVFRSDAGVVLEAWAVMVERRAVYDALCADLAVEFPDHQLLERQSSGGHCQFAGLSGVGSPGELWRLVSGRHNDFWWPSKRSKAGVALHERLGAIRFERAPMPGMPHWLMDHSTGSVVTCGARLADGAVWAHWNRQREVVEPLVDLALWSLSPLSKYHAALEASELVGAGQ